MYYQFIKHTAFYKEREIIRFEYYFKICKKKFILKHSQQRRHLMLNAHVQDPLDNLQEETTLITELGESPPRFSIKLR